MINGVLHIIASPILDENSLQVGIVLALRVDLVLINQKLKS